MSLVGPHPSSSTEPCQALLEKKEEGKQSSLNDSVSYRRPNAAQPFELTDVGELEHSSYYQRLIPVLSHPSQLEVVFEGKSLEYLKNDISSEQKQTRSGHSSISEKFNETEELSLFTYQQESELDFQEQTCY